MWRSLRKCWQRLPIKPPHKFSRYALRSRISLLNTHNRHNVRHNSSFPAEKAVLPPDTAMNILPSAPQARPRYEDMTIKSIASGDLKDNYDVIVVGGGHAGCEAAAAAVRGGASVLLCTHRAEGIGIMSCNPSIGGVGKGHLVREIDAMDGLMGRAADYSMLQARTLNLSKGAAVHGPRIQADRDMYRFAIQSMLNSEYVSGRLYQGSLDVLECEVVDLDVLKYSGTQHTQQYTPRGGSYRVSGVKVMLDKDIAGEAAMTQAAEGKISNYISDTQISPSNDQVGVRNVNSFADISLSPEALDSTHSSHEVTIPADNVILATGTFLSAVMHIGPDVKVIGGRDSDAGSSSHRISHTLLQELQLPVERLTTATPPRVKASSVDTSSMQVEMPESVPEPIPLSFLYNRYTPAQIQRQSPCFSVQTGSATKTVVAEHMNLLPTFRGNDGKGTGPRYCPSIEKKYVRFPQRTQHKIWLEPEGFDNIEITKQFLNDHPEVVERLSNSSDKNTHSSNRGMQEDDTSVELWQRDFVDGCGVIYPNGLSTGFPPDIQVELVRTLPGMESASLLKYGYAVEYDFIQPKGVIRASFEARECDGLFLAGQINGSTGYEEAGVQGLLAGLNAALSSKALAHIKHTHTDKHDESISLSNSPMPHYGYVSFDRAEGLCGVLTADLTEKGVTEPYRMFTSRSEFRMICRADNADLRMTRALEDKWAAAVAQMCPDDINSNSDMSSHQVLHPLRTHMTRRKHALITLVSWLLRDKLTYLGRDYNAAQKELSGRYGDIAAETDKKHTHTDKPDLAYPRVAALTKPLSVWELLRAGNFWVAGVSRLNARGTGPLLPLQASELCQFLHTLEHHDTPSEYGRGYDKVYTCSSFPRDLRCPEGFSCENRDGKGHFTVEDEYARFLELTSAWIKADSRWFCDKLAVDSVGVSDTVCESGDNGMRGVSIAGYWDGLDWLMHPCNTSNNRTNTPSQPQSDDAYHDQNHKTPDWLQILHEIPGDVWHGVLTEARYEHAIARQNSEISQLRSQLGTPLDVVDFQHLQTMVERADACANADGAPSMHTDTVTTTPRHATSDNPLSLGALRREEVDVLLRFKPSTIGEALKLPGIRQVGMSWLLSLKANRRRNSNQ